DPGPVWSSVAHCVAAKNRFPTWISATDPNLSRSATVAVDRGAGSGDRRGGGDPIDLGPDPVVEVPRGRGGRVGPDLLRAGRPGDDARDQGLGGQPRQRQVVEGVAVAGRDVPQLLHHREAVLVEEPLDTVRGP